MTTEAYKDKIEVSLDGRQIFYLFFGGAVIVGLVFVLGVMVGRRVEARGHLDHARTSAASDPLAALDRLDGRERGARETTASDATALAFPTALRGEQIKAPVDDKIAELGAQRAAAPPEPPAPLVAPVAPAKPAADKKPDKKPAADKADKKPEKKPEKARYTLQLSSFHDKAEAEAYLETIRTAGFSPYLAEGEVDGKQFYRVRLGSYRTLDAANDGKAAFEKQASKTAYVTKL
jgi:cell division protein FtsN